MGTRSWHLSPPLTSPICSSTSSSRSTVGLRLRTGQSKLTGMPGEDVEEESEDEGEKEGDGGCEETRASSGSAMEKCWDGRIGTYRNRQQPSFNCSRPKPRGPASSPPKSRPVSCGRPPNTENGIFSGQPIRYQWIHRGQLAAPAQSSLRAYQALKQKTTTPRMPCACAVHHGAWEMAGQPQSTTRGRGTRPGSLGWPLRHAWRRRRTRKRRGRREA